MNALHIERRRKELRAEIREMHLRCNWMGIEEKTKELTKLDNQAVDLRRERYSALAKKAMTNEEIADFTAILIEMSMIGSLAEDVGMRMEGFLSRWKDFSSPDLQKFQYAVKLFGQSTSTINEVSKTHPIANENGEVYTLNEHFGGMLDEAEGYLAGFQNMIRNIVRKNLKFDKDDIERYKNGSL